MAERKSALAQLHEKRLKEAKEYKTSHDVAHAHHLIGAMTQLKDQTNASALAASFARELHAMNLKQMELDAKEKEESEKETREAYASDTKKNGKEDEEDEPHGNPTMRAPSVPRRT